MKTPRIPRVTSREEREAKSLDGFADRQGANGGKTDMGGIKLIPPGQGMQPCSLTPCAECPLRRDALPGHLGGYTPAMYIQAMRSPASLACHSSKGFQTGVLHTQRHCTGVAAWRAIMNHVAAIPHPTLGPPYVVPTGAHESTTVMRQAMLAGIADPKLYFDSEESFVEHHTVQPKER